MPLTARRLNRATLARQLLLRREPLSAVDAIHRIVAVQAQEPASPYVALWNRVADFDPRDLDTAFASRAVIKATLMRITLHAVDAADYPTFHHAMAGSLRAARLADRRFVETGLSVEDADALVADVLDFCAEPRTNADVEAWVEQRLGRTVPNVWWALRTFAPVLRAPESGGSWSHGRRAAYLAAGCPPPTGDPAPAVQRLVRRYLEGFGPASAQDIGQFTILRMPPVRSAVEAMAGALETFTGPTGEVLFDIPGAPMPAEDSPAPPRLMAMWDSILLAYADRGRVLPGGYRSAVIRRNGDVLPTVLVDGYVAGVWRPADDGIEVTAFHSLGEDAWAGLAREAKALVTLLAARQPDVYRRYSRWWDSLPAHEVRVLPG